MNLKELNCTKFMVFDVESVGLHGEGFAVGYVVFDNGKKLEEGLFACGSIHASGSHLGRDWVCKNVIIPQFNSEDPYEVRNGFWQRWQYYRDRGFLLAADCPWPVEARFLIQCVNDDPHLREWLGPYPLIDIASIRFAIGLHPLASEKRLEDELPIHNPLADAKQSARLLFEALNGSQKRCQIDNSIPS